MQEPIKSKDASISGALERQPQSDLGPQGKDHSRSCWNCLAFGIALSHGSRRFTQSSYVGEMCTGASWRAPSFISASPTPTAKRREPHVGQNRRPSKVSVGPDVSKPLSGQTPKYVKAEPLSCLQSVQWHIPTRSGSPVTENLTLPHRQLPCRVVIRCLLNSRRLSAGFRLL